MRKILMGLLALTILLSAGSAFAKLDGTWEGEGKGFCYPPFPTPYAYQIYAWQKWTGEVADEKVFFGKWEDEKGNYGEFKGEILPISPSPDIAICKGVWTWYNIFIDPPKAIEMGPFTMTFYIEKEYCEGKWWSYSAETARPGTMWGKRVGE